MMRLAAEHSFRSRTSFVESRHFPQVAAFFPGTDNFMLSDVRPDDITPEEARMRAAQYRQMAETAATEDVREALIRLAEKYDELGKAGKLRSSADY